MEVEGYLFEAGGDAPATGLHNAVVPPHVLPDLPVLLPALLAACRQRRVAEERRNTVTGQPAGERGGRAREEKGGREKPSISSLASQ